MSVLVLRDLTLEVDGETFVTGLDLDLSEGEKLLVFGRSQAALAALLKTVAGILRPPAGEALVRGPKGRRGVVGFSSVEGGLLNNLTLAQNAALPAFYHGGRSAGHWTLRAERLLRDWGLEEQAWHRPADATMMARRLTLLARAVLSEPALFVLDDPLGGLDASSSAAVRRAMEEVLGRKDATVVVGTRKPKRYLDRCGRFLWLRPGGWASFEDGEALSNAEDAEVAALLDKGGGS